MSIQSAIENLKAEMEKESITPVVNLDLLITSGRQILLSWRNDRYCGQGWHIPDGCVRFKDRPEERI